MKIAAVALFSSLFPRTNAIGFRNLIDSATHKESKYNAAAAVVDEAAVAAVAPIATDQLPAAVDGTADQHRRAQVTCLESAEWHPQYSAGWAGGFCRLTVDCNSPGYTTQLACCRAAYAGQVSGNCLANLPSPPTMSPTDSGGLDVYYPDYATPWTQAGCINTRPLPSGRPTYSSQLACCKAAYGGQVSGTCISQLPSPPTMSPTESGGLDVYYPDYSQTWSAGVCINTRPMPNSRPTYSSQLACCKGAYAGQASGFCLSQLPSPPTMSPTGAGGLDVYYPDYATAYSNAGCINTRPMPNGLPTYSSQLACCKAAYAGQTSGVCLSQLPSPPTMSPTGAGGLDVYYPDYATAYSNAGCINTRPMPNGRFTYSSQLACCKAAYAGQASGACLSQLASPPTMSPTDSGGLDVFYPDYATAYSNAGCINTRPLPSGRPTYATQESCCRGAYAGQSSGACMCEAVGVCFSCVCGTAAERTAAGCTLVCS